MDVGRKIYGRIITNIKLLNIILIHIRLDIGKIEAIEIFFIDGTIRIKIAFNMAREVMISFFCITEIDREGILPQLQVMIEISLMFLREDPETL